MRLVSFEILVVEIPLRGPVAHALAERRAARNVVVAAHDGEGRTGWGESCPRSYVTGESVEGARDLLRARILPELLSRSRITRHRSISLGLSPRGARSPGTGAGRQPG